MPRRREQRYRDMNGINLFHAGRSNCSARVRLLLSEKAIAWNSHLISLKTRENRSPEYFAINPKGLVPSLIHDGWVITESNDILYYLEESFPVPSFQPNTAVERSAMSNWLDRSAELHLPGVKTLNYSQRRSYAEVKSPDEWIRYRNLQTDQELIRFHERASGEGFSTDERAAAEHLLTRALSSMDEWLMKKNWLAGETYSLADICWAPTIPTVIRSGLDLAPFPYVRAWHQRIVDRRAYGEAVTKWELAS